MAIEKGFGDVDGVRVVQSFTSDEGILEVAIGDPFSDEDEGAGLGGGFVDFDDLI